MTCEGCDKGWPLSTDGTTHLDPLIREHRCTKEKPMSEELKCPVHHGLDATKQDLPSLPARMKGLPFDHRGFVVPWFVDKDDKTGLWEFRAMDPRKLVRAVREKRCWVCGEQLGRWLVFVAGPMCGINRTTGEPASHRECALWSMANCPFLNNPEFERRVDDVIGYHDDRRVGAIQRNPGITMLWTCRDYSIWQPQPGQVLITMGEPEKVEFFRCGRVATRAEVLASVESGIPHLSNVARMQQGGLAELEKAMARFAPFLPVE